jgi:hypothetical protein
MSTRDDAASQLELAEAEQAEEEGTESELYLDAGRTLKVRRAGVEQLVEVRAASGQLELRIRLTDEGPVLQMEAVKLALHAEDAVAIKCKTFEVEASADTVIQSGGELKIKAQGEVEVDSPEDVRIRGKIIWLN